MDILDRIVQYKKAEVADAKKEQTIGLLEKSKWFNHSTNSFVSTLDSSLNSGVIAEFKRKSPSKQDINLRATIEDIGPAYIQGGAGAISILTDQFFFGGHNEYLSKAKELLPSTPLLRKEFIIDEYQIIEAKSIGADIILLIAEILTKKEVNHFSKLAKSLDMEVLLELHSETQLDKYCPGVSMVGVNNRDLKTFEIDYERSKKLFDSLPKEVPKISESGLQDWQTLVMLYDYGFKGFLIGEQFMKADSPGTECKTLIDQFMSHRSKKQNVN
jgi:indole-3-glycerol phosphate synthase